MTAGEMLDYCQSLEFFKTHREVQLFPCRFTFFSQIMILLPILLGIRGDLEMTLAARLSTSSNLGLLKEKDTVTPRMIYETASKFLLNKSEGNTSPSLIFGNYAIVQTQAISVGLGSAVWAWILGGCKAGDHFVTLSALAILSASLSSTFMTFFLSWIMAFCRKNSVDPDNVAIPLCNSAGDLIIILILACFGESFVMGKWIPYVIVALSMAGLFGWTRVVLKDPYLAEILHEAWYPMVYFLFPKL